MCQEMSEKEYDIMYKRSIVIDQIIEPKGEISMGDIIKMEIKIIYALEVFENLIFKLNALDNEIVNAKVRKIIFKRLGI